MLREVLNDIFEGFVLIACLVASGFLYWAAFAFFIQEPDICEWWIIGRMLWLLLTISTGSGWASSVLDGEEGVF